MPTGGPGGSRPEDRNAIRLQLRVVGDERQPLGLGLRHEHAVERVVVVAGEAPRGQRMGHRDGQRMKAVGGQGLGEVVGRLESAESLLDADFPRGGGAHKDEHIGLANRRPRSGGQGRVIGEPPQQGVGVEQERQGASPRKAAAMGSGSPLSKSAARRTRPRQ
jgi:hypothetical protein